MKTATTSAGYSGTPLSKKLGIKAGSKLRVVQAPPNYLELLAPLPTAVVFEAVMSNAVDIVHLFVTEKSVLSQHLAELRGQLDPRAMVWVSWPKKAAKVVTDISEDSIRELALPLGFVDIKVCAVDAVWSGLKLVIRKQLG